MIADLPTDTLIAAELQAIEHGEVAAAEILGYKPDTLRRYRGELKKRGVDLSALKDAQRVVEMFDRDELKKILRSGAVDPYTHERHHVDFEGDTLRFVAVGDTHFGSKYSPPEYWDAVVEQAEAFGADYIFHDGDLSEGMSNRAGHVYELRPDGIGYDAQKRLSLDALSKTDIPIFIIDGNHDRWFRKTNGALIVKDVAEQLEHVTFLGHDSATVTINGIDIMLWHGEDGASYAVSYRPQKVVEAIPPHERPHIIIMGHTHKAGVFQPEGVHAITAGSVQRQTGWMRSTRKAAHVGFYLVEATIGDGRIKEFTTTWKALE